jgi:hypothetical protein
MSGDREEPWPSCHTAVARWLAYGQTGFPMAHGVDRSGDGRGSVSQSIRYVRTSDAGASEVRWGRCGRRCVSRSARLPSGVIWKQLHWNLPSSTQLPIQHGRDSTVHRGVISGTTDLEVSGRTLSTLTEGEYETEAKERRRGKEHRHRERRVATKSSEGLHSIPYVSERYI